MSARVSGHVLKLNVQDNQFVEAGTVLVEIDPTDYEISVNRARADYEDALATAAAAGVNIPITNVNTGSQLSSAQANVDNAHAGVPLQNDNWREQKRRRRKLKPTMQRRRAISLATSNS